MTLVKINSKKIFNKVGVASKQSTISGCGVHDVVYPCRTVHAGYHARTHANTEYMWDCHLVARTCNNKVGVAISIRDSYTSPFTS